MIHGLPSPGAASTDQASTPAAPAREILTYDEIQMAAPLVECSTCGRSFYMTKPQPTCIECRQGITARRRRLNMTTSPFALYPEEKHWWSFNDYGAVLDVVRARSAKRVLEFGPGSSTLALVEGGATTIDTCEDDPKWLDVYRRRLGMKFPGIVEVRAYTWAAPLTIATVDHERYDLALIDGPHDTPRRPVVLEYCLQRCRAVLIPTEDHKVSSPPLRPHIARLGDVYRASVEIVETGALSGAFALMFPGARS